MRCCSNSSSIAATFVALHFILCPPTCGAQSIMERLAQAPDYQTGRVSSFDQTGGNNDRLTSIQPGETRVLAEIEGPGAITHIWNTLSAERYYSRMLILRMYWDGESVPSVEVPLGDFFGVGHGLDRAYQSFAAAVSSEGRARNCYWLMPFQKSAKITVTHEGFYPVRFFYYYIDYRTYDSPQRDALFFHAQYRQQRPNKTIDLNGVNQDGKSNYLALDTNGKGKYVGTVLSAQLNRPGWFGEGDDMFYIDGDEAPTITGTGTEDYFNDAWGFREFAFPYHGVTLWEGSDVFSRVTAYKWHIHDPVSFKQSLRFSIEHGHANDRQDDWSTVAFWYQTLPGPQPPAMAGVFERLPKEGQRYAQRLFLNKELALHFQEGRLDEAAKRIDETIAEDALADEHGYWSLKKGTILKRMKMLDEAETVFQSAAQKSQRPAEDLKALEGDAPWIHELAMRELETLEDNKQIHFHIVADWNDEYEIFIDGESVAQGTGGETVRHHAVRVSRGKRILAVRYANEGGRGGVAISMSHPRGYVETGEAWRVSNALDENWNQRKYDDSKWSQAEAVGTLGEGDWAAIREPYHFITSVYSPDVIWIPKTMEPKDEIFFRKEVQW